MIFTCPLCTNGANEAFTAKVLASQKAHYGYCQRCGLLFANKPDWLENAYRHPIAQTDTGILRRNIINTLRFTSILGLLFNRRASFLDYAGGCGLFTRMMRDIGFDFYWHDKFCENNLARGFEHHSDKKYSAVTVLEALEHIPDPLSFIKTILDDTGCNSIIFSTTVFSGKPPPLDWQYYAFESGQHICFYQTKTLAYLAKSMNMNYIYGGDLHLITKISISSFWFRLLSSRWGLPIFPIVLLLLKSRTQSDFLLLRDNPSTPNNQKKPTSES